MNISLSFCFLFLVGLANPGHSALLGGRFKQELGAARAEDLALYNTAANNAVQLMNDATKEANCNQNLLVFQKLVSVSTQIVAGVKYYITMKVLKDGKVQDCNVTVFNMFNNDKAHEGGTWELGESCAPCVPPPVVKQIRKRSAHLLGGDRPARTDDKQVQEAAHWALEHINFVSNSLFRQVYVGVSNARTQVVNGYRYHFQLTTAPSECTNTQGNKNKGLEECPLSTTGKAHKCDVSLIHSSTGVYKMETFSCIPISQEPGLLGKELHEYLPRGRPYHMSKKLLGMAPLSSKRDNSITQMHIGGDDHDYLPHGNAKCAHHREAFETFKVTHNKMYGSYEDEQERFMVFCENMDRVKSYQKQDRGSAVYGATKFADISEAEFKKKYLGLKAPSAGHSAVWPDAKIPQGSFPENFDWRDHGAVTPVKNQGECGSCWAFSTTGNIEGQWARVNKKLYSLSEQELVDCDKVDEGCNGGLPSQAYEAIMKIGGLETEKDYKYDGQDEKCKFNKSEVVVTLNGAVNISKNETEMASWLYQNGPISIGINAFAMQFYMWGIAHPWRIFCNPSESSLDHGVLIVGYGVEKGEPYWIVKNSWGPDWGRQGYYYVYRGDGTCGLNQMCTSGQVKKQ